MLKKILSFIFIITISVTVAISQNLTYKTYKSSEISCARLVYTQVFNNHNKNNTIFSKKNETLLSIVVEGIRYGDIKVYSASGDFGEEFEIQIDSTYAFEKLGQKTKEQFVQNEDDKYEKKMVVTPFNENEITSYLFAELWLYGKNNCPVQKITIGFCPLREVYEEWDVEKSHVNYEKTFWVYFPENQKYFSTKKVTDGRTFEELLFWQDYKAINLSDIEDYEEFYENDFDENYKYYQKQVDFYSDWFVNIEDFKFYQDEIPGYKQEFKRNLPHLFDPTMDFISSVQLVYKRVWKKDIVNYPLFYPKDAKFGYQNLISLVVEKASENELTLYQDDNYFGNEFKNPITFHEASETLGAKTEKIVYEDYNGELVEATVEHPIDLNEITSFIIEELHLYDSKNELVQVRTIGFCPIREYYREDDFKQEKPLYKKTFWVYFPEFQDYCVKNIYKTDCDAPEITIEEFMFNQKYEGVRLDDTLAWETLKNYNDKIGAANYYTNHFLNIHSNDEDVQKYKMDISPVEIEQKEYKHITKKDFKKAEIVTLEITEEDNPNIFLPRGKTFGFEQLLDIILSGLETGKNYYSDDGLENVITTNEVLTALGQKYVDIESITDEGKDTVITYLEEYNSEDIKSFLLKELWFYDKAGDIVDKRILAICPVLGLSKDECPDGVDVCDVPTFWISFPEFSDIFRENYIYKNKLESTKNYYNYFVNHEYNTIEFSKNKISKGKAKKYLLLFE